MAETVTNYGRMTQEEIESELKLLKNSWDMYEKTKKESLEERQTRRNKDGSLKYSEADTKKAMAIMETMQNDIKRKYLQLGGSIEDLMAAPTKKKRGSKNTISKEERMKMIKAIREGAAKMEEEQPLIQPTEKVESEFIIQQPEVEDEDPPMEETIEEEPVEKNIDGFSVDPVKAMGSTNTIKYDTIPLPSKGECYPTKNDKIPVAYLTAYDENMIMSPNMYKDGMFLDHILKAKIMTNEIDVDELLPGDRDAIILWLRASGYGTDFPITATDNETGVKFDAVIDLRKLGYKKFNLKGDKNGYFDYKMESTGDKIKFKFLTYGDLKEVNKMEENDNLRIRKAKLYECAEEIDEFINSTDILNKLDKSKLLDGLRPIKKFVNDIQDDDDEELFSHVVTDRMEMCIVSVNGITDRSYISNYVRNMNIKDAFNFRKYVSDNEPGVDFNIQVERPESLGGGSVTQFLTIDQYIFLNVVS